MKQNEDTAAADMMHDLDRMKGLAGKEWSVFMAKKLGLTEAEIKKYMSRGEQAEKK